MKNLITISLLFVLTSFATFAHAAEELQIIEMAPVPGDITTTLTELQISFDTDVEAVTGVATIYTDENILVDQIPVDGGDVHVDGSIVTLSTDASFEEGESYYVTIPPQTFVGVGGEEFVGITKPTSWTFTVGQGTNLAPILASVTATEDSISVTWDTAEELPTSVEYGLTPTYGNTVQEGGEYSATLTNLLPCTTYHYRIVSGEQSSMDYKTTTRGCVEGYTVHTSFSKEINSEIGGTLQVAEGASSLEVTIPAGAIETDLPLVIQLTSYIPSEEVETVSSDERHYLTGTPLFDVEAIVNETIPLLQVTGTPLTVSYTHNPTTSIDASTWWLYQKSDTGWVPLETCSIQVSESTISCTTSQLQTLALFTSKQTPPTSLLASGTCSPEQTLSDNLKKGDRNGEVSEYNGGVVTQVDLLQSHINRILQSQYQQAAGPVDGIFGPLTQQGVERLQTALNEILKPTPPLIIDGIVGPFTREAINNSCGEENEQSE